MARSLSNQNTERTGGYPVQFVVIQPDSSDQNSLYLNTSYRKLDLNDLDLLYELIQSQKKSDLEYFNPHGFDPGSILKQYSNPSFLMMGVFEGDKMLGYFFLRFFVNRKWI